MTPRGWDDEDGVVLSLAISLGLLAVSAAALCVWRLL